MITETIDLLGLTGRDKVTGSEGIVTTVSFDLYGCAQLWLTPLVDKDGKRPDGTWYDVNRIDVNTAVPRVMPVPDFAAAAVKPKDFAHGPSEKSAPRQ